MKTSQVLPFCYLLCPYAALELLTFLLHAKVQDPSSPQARLAGKLIFAARHSGSGSYAPAQLPIDGAGHRRSQQKPYQSNMHALVFEGLTVALDVLEKFFDGLEGQPDLSEYAQQHAGIPCTSQVYVW